jgi:hypothetical protein
MTNLSAERIADGFATYLRGGQFFATWPCHRYGVKLAAIRLIEKPISIDEITRRWPSLGWAKQPHSICTVRKQRLADQIRKQVYG